MRLDRFLANMGCGTRSEVKIAVRSGNVTVNTQNVRDSAQQVNPEKDIVCFFGEAIVYREHIYLMLNKPAGVISATEDSRERTVLDLLPEQYRHKALFPVGRLDKDTEGLLLLTDDGDLGHELLSPKKHVTKEYWAKLDLPATSDDVSAFAEGIFLDDGYRTLPAELELPNVENQSEVLVRIHEGKFHQIKRMFQACGKNVVYLKRLKMGSLELDESLQLGEYRELTSEEVLLLQQGGKS